MCGAAGIDTDHWQHSVLSSNKQEGRCWAHGCSSGISKLTMLQSLWNALKCVYQTYSFFCQRYPECLLLLWSRDSYFWLFLLPPNIISVVCCFYNEYVLIKNVCLCFGESNLLCCLAWVSSQLRLCSASRCLCRRYQSWILAQLAIKI